jgi:hypothetical protein
MMRNQLGLPICTSTISRCALAFVLAALAGCAKTGQVDVVDRTDFENLAKIQYAYTEATQKLGHTPKDMKEFRPFLEKQGDADKLLISPFDRQPYVILWNVNMQGFSREARTPAIIAFDRVGSDGERHVLTVSGITIMSDEHFEEARQAWKIDLPREKTQSSAKRQ